MLYSFCFYYIYLASFIAWKKNLTNQIYLLLPLPLPHTHNTPQRLPQEPLSSLEGILPNLQIKVLYYRSNNQFQLHLSQIPAYTRARTCRKGDKRGFLACSQSSFGFQPSIGLEFLHVCAPDPRAVVERVCGYGEDGVGGEMVIQNGYWMGYRAW